MAESTEKDVAPNDELAKLRKALAAAEAKIAALPQFDKLTQLPNKPLFEDRLNLAMARARRSQRLMSVLMLDVEHTKLITKKLGVVGKNTLTREFVARFKSVIRETDTLARAGFERYAVVLEEVKSRKQVKALVAKIIEYLDQGFVIEGHDIAVKTSIGVSFYDGGDQSTAQVISWAESALKKAKSTGGNTYVMDEALGQEDN